MSNSETGYITTSDYVNHPITTFNNNAILITDNSTPSDVLSTATMTDGQLIIGSSSGIPQAANLIAGANIVITEGPNSIQIDASGSGLGTVTSVGLTLPASVFSVSGSPVVTMGTLAGALINQAINTFFMGPSTGGSTTPTFRQITANDITPLNTNGQLLIGNTTNGYPSVSTLTAGSNVTIVNAPGSITISSANGTITLTGDVTGSGSSSIATTIASHVVSFAKMQQVTGPVLLGLDTGTADIAALSTNSTIDLSGATVKRAAITGDISIANNSNTSTINNGVVTYAKMQNETASTLLGNPTGLSASPSEITLGTGLSFTGTVLNALFSGTVTSFSFTNANGVSGVVTNATTTPNLTISLGAITPTTVNGITFSGSATPTLAITGTSSISGSNTGDQTITLTSDITGSGVGTFATTIGANKVTYAKFQQVNALALVGNPTASLANATNITLGAGLSFSGTTLVNSNPTAGVTSVALSAPAEFTVSGSPVSGSGTLSFAKATQLTNLVYASPSGSTGVPTFRSLVNADLPVVDIAHGGTNSASALNNNRIMVSSGSAIVESAALTNGQLLIGSTSAAPVVSTITAGSGISVTNGAGSISIAATGSALTIGTLSTTSTANALDITGSVLTAHVGGSSNQGVGHVQTSDVNPGIGVRNCSVGIGSMPDFATAQFNSKTGNCALGDQAYNYNNTAVAGARNNCIVGARGFGAVTSGASNVAMGVTAFTGLTTGTGNCAFGHSAGFSVTTGSDNILIGNQISTVNQNATGSTNIYIGNNIQSSSTSVSNEYVIGHGVTGQGANTLTVRLANIPVVVNTTVSINTTTGQLTRIASSQRYKTPVSNNPNLSDMANALYSLQPKSYYFNADPKEQVRIGYYAENLQDFVDSNGNHIFEPILNYIDLEDGNGLVPDDINYYFLVVPIIINQTTQRNQITTLQSTVSSQATAISTLQSQVATLQSQVASQQTSILSLNASVGVIKAVLHIPDDIPNYSTIAINEDGEVVKANSFNKMKNSIIGINVNGSYVSSGVCRVPDSEVTSTNWIKLKAQSDPGYSYWLLR